MNATWVHKVGVALIPLLIGALVTVAWQNSHTLTLLVSNQEMMRLELERLKASLEPGRTIMLRFDQTEKELTHLRELVEQRLTCK